MKLFSLLTALFFTSLLYSQNEVDAIRYSQENIGSTARSYAVGGAFGAVGADPSCAAINPAGLARFRTSKLYFNMAFYNAKNRTTYQGEEITANKFNFNLPNIGVLVNIRGKDYDEKKPKGFVNFNLSYNLNRLNNYHKKTDLNGINNLSSITQDWAERGTQAGVIPDEMSPYSLEYQAYQAYTIDVDTNSASPAYISAYGNTPINVRQKSSNLSIGALNDNNFAFAANYRNLIQGGITIGWKHVRYIEENSFVEEDRKTGNIKDIKSVTLNKYLNTKGSGFNAKVGLIITPSEYFRFGYSFHSPTVFNLTDSYTYTIISVFDYGAKDVLGADRVNTTASTGNTLYKYKITTPARHVMSLCMINKAIGFISMDLEYVNYASASLDAKDYKFIDENQNIKNDYNSVFNLKMGVEVVDDKFRYRAGYARYPSPYKSSIVPDLSTMVNNVYSLGFGIKTDKYSIDAAYVNSGYSDYFMPYTLESGNQPVATNNVRASNIVFTIGLNLD